MKITKKEDFSLIFMGILAENYPGKFLSLSYIAAKTNLSGLFLKHIASALLRKKLIMSKEGIDGGYKLSKDPKKIKIADILSAKSHTGLLLPCEQKFCRVDKNNCRCENLWTKINHQLTSYLQKITLVDFIHQ